MTLFFCCNWERELFEVYFHITFQILKYDVCHYLSFDYLFCSIFVA